jgi:hypothetical protein
MEEASRRREWKRDWRELEVRAMDHSSNQMTVGRNTRGSAFGLRKSG